MTKEELDALQKSTTLPAPRLQLRWSPSAIKPEYKWLCHYELVLPLQKGDIRRDVYDDDGELIGEISELAIPINPPTMRESTRAPCTALDGSRYYDDPYRDGAHAQLDAKVLGGLPIFVIAPDGMTFERAASDTGVRL